MESPTRTLVAVAPHGPNAHTHVLYFSDGTVVGYQPEHGRVLWEHRLAPDVGGGPPRRTPDSGVPAAVAAWWTCCPNPRSPGDGRRRATGALALTSVTSAGLIGPVGLAAARRRRG